jgi:hypothetical protein
MNGRVHGLVNIQKGNDSYNHSYTGTLHQRIGDQKSVASRVKQFWLPGICLYLYKKNGAGGR